MVAQNGDIRALRGIVRSDVRGVTVEDMHEAIETAAVERFRRATGGER